MTAEAILGLIIRLVGLLSMLMGLHHGVYALLQYADTNLVPAAQYPASSHAIGALMYLVMGFIIVKAADGIVKFAYKK